MLLLLLLLPLLLLLLLLLILLLLLLLPLLLLLLLLNNQPLSSLSSSPSAKEDAVPVSPSNKHTQDELFICLSHSLLHKDAINGILEVFVKWFDKF